MCYGSAAAVPHADGTATVTWSAFEMSRSAPGKRATAAAPIVRTDTGAAARRTNGEAVTVTESVLTTS